MSEQETKKQVACEFGLYLLRKLLDEDKITVKQFEKAAAGFIEDIDCKFIAS